MEQNSKQILIKKLLKEKIKTRADLSKVKRETAKKFNTSLPSNIALLKAYHKLLRAKKIKRAKKIENLLRKKPIRSLSGIVNVSVLTKPYPCPGECVFCPTERGMPKSYLAGEPAADRAKALNFAPYLQTKKRIEQLKAQGHPTDKIELRIVGGTWSSYPKPYQTRFVKKCFQAANNCQNFPTAVRKSEQGQKEKSLRELQKENEKANCRIVGISIETRPDFVTEKEILRLRRLGVTLVELGVQTIFDDVHKKCKTRLTADKIAKATKLLKDAGFKVLYQIMPNLPGSDIKRDLKCFKILFQDQRFKPDWLKIYPCVVCKKTELFNWWKRQEYKPYSNKELINLLIEVKKDLPYWVRITRIFRDIPVQKIKAGCKISNLREVVQEEMKKKEIFCKCIRCREIRERYNPKEKIYLFREDYKASNGREIFLSFENKNRTKLYSLLRLRIPSFIPQILEDKPFLVPVLQNSAIVREVQTFGLQLPIKNLEHPMFKISPQHKGLGKKLIKKAEEITKKEFGLPKIAIISGIGVRNYFRKLGCKEKETYLVKELGKSLD